MSTSHAQPSDAYVPPPYLTDLEQNLITEAIRLEARHDLISLEGYDLSPEERAREREFLEEQLREGSGAARGSSGYRRRRGAKPPHHSPEALAAMGRLQARIERLEQLQGWLHDDPDLFHVIDSTIGDQVRAAEQRQCKMAEAQQKRQRFLAFCAAAVTLVAGWLLSAVRPATVLLRILPH